MNLSIVTAALLLAGAPAPAAAPPKGELVQRDTIERTLKFGDPAADHRVIVDNVSGPITVTGYDGTEVKLTAYRKTKAESRERLREAIEEVTLDIEEKSDRILCYVNAPWRRDDGSVNYRGWEYYGYDVDYEFELKVPVKTRVTLRTVNEGDIDVTNVTGDFEVRNVNGDIAMREVSGSGKATTVNGDVEVSFRKNPTDECSFKTVNGKVDVEFPEKVSANIRLKTMNGDVYSDFPVKHIPQQVTSSEKGGRKLYKGGDSFVVEAGGGGPELSFDTLNGDIYLSLKGDL